MTTPNLALVLAQRAACDAMIDISFSDCTARMCIERDRLYPRPTRPRTRTLSTQRSVQIVNGKWHVCRQDEFEYTPWATHNPAGDLNQLPRYHTIADLRLLLEILECPEEDMP